MAYGKIVVQGLISENSDYSNPYAKTLSGAQTETPVSHYHLVVPVPTTYLPIDFSTIYGTNMESVTAVAIRNRDTTNYVKAIFYSLLETIANPGGSGFTFASSAKTITDAQSGNSFANVQPGDLLYSANASNSANRTGFLVANQNSDNQVTLASSCTDSSNDTTATFLRGRQNELYIKPGRWLVIPGDFMMKSIGTDPQAEIFLQANTSAVECEIFAFSS
tara:strand:+ start:5181 stop:5840 length:660 start_codon:yes stop_codon:yes gene_type:complete